MGTLTWNTARMTSSFFKQWKHYPQIYWKPIGDKKKLIWSKIYIEWNDASYNAAQVQSGHEKPKKLMIKTVLSSEYPPQKIKKQFFFFRQNQVIFSKATRKTELLVDIWEYDIDFLLIHEIPAFNLLYEELFKRKNYLAIYHKTYTTMTLFKEEVYLELNKHLHQASLFTTSSLLILIH